jgi:dipeptidyl aminopeptidase/acylaminoacyl peptidase
VSFVQKSFEPQAIFVARFAPDGQTLIYSAARQGSAPEIFSIRPEYPESRPLESPQTHLLSVSSQGELAVLTHARFIAHRLFAGTLARMPLGGGAPREVLENVREADWSADGSSLAIIHEVDGKDRLEFPIGRVLWQTAGYLSDARVSPKGDRVAFFEHPARYDDRGLVAVVDRSGRRTVLSDGYAGEEGLAWSPKGDEVLFSGQLTSTAGGSALTVYAVTLSGKRRVALESAGGLTIQDVSRDGRWLVTRDDLRLSLLARAPGEKQERDLSWLDGPIFPDLSGDGRTVLFTDESWTAGPYYTVCLRKTDGSPVVRLGEGMGWGLSPDGAWALAIVSTTPQQLRLYPTGPGQPRTLERGNLEGYETAAWFRDGRAVLACGHEPGHASRCYAQDIAGGPPRPVTPEGTSGGRPSPDGKFMLAFGSGKASLYPVADGAPRPLPQLASEDQVLRWSPDGRSLWVRRRESMPVRIERFDLETGRRELIEEITPQDRTGLLEIFRVSLADDPGSYVYNPSQTISHLFVVE